MLSYTMTISAIKRHKNTSETETVFLSFLYALQLFCLKTAPAQFNYFLSRTGQVFKSSAPPKRLLADRGEMVSS